MKTVVAKRDVGREEGADRIAGFLDDRLYRFAQDDYPIYGNQLWGFEITGLTTTTYAEVPVSDELVLKASGTGWNELGMHHAAPHFIDGRWLVYVDGVTRKTVFGRQQ